MNHRPANMSDSSDIRAQREKFLARLLKETPQVVTMEQPSPPVMPDQCTQHPGASNGIASDQPQAEQPTQDPGASNGTCQTFQKIVVSDQPQAEQPTQDLGASNDSGSELALVEAVSSKNNTMSFTFNIHLNGDGATSAAAFLPQLFGQFMGQPRRQQAVVVEEVLNDADEGEPPKAVLVEPPKADLGESPKADLQEPLHVDQGAPCDEEQDEIVDLTGRSPSPDFSFLQDFSDDEETDIEDDPDDDFVPSRPILLQPQSQRPKRSLSLTLPPKKRAVKFNPFTPQSNVPAKVRTFAEARAAIAAVSSRNMDTQPSSSMGARVAGAQTATSTTAAANLARARAAMVSAAAGAAPPTTTSAAANLARARAAMVSAAAGAAPPTTTSAAANLARARAAMVSAAAGAAEPSPTSAVSNMAQASASAESLVPSTSAASGPTEGERGTCSVCMSAEVTQKLKCRHCYCLPCLQQLKAMKKPCPKCRYKFRKWSPVYL